MSETSSSAPARSLLSVLRSLQSPDGLPSFKHIVLYTSFGVVRGRASLSFAQELAGEDHNAERGRDLLYVIELNDATVEHYSNHLPTAAFDRFYVRLGDVNGFTLIEMQK